MSKIIDGIIGHAVGDALGVPVENTLRETLDEFPVTGMRGYQVHNQPPGTWSDDTSLTLCLVESLTEKGLDYNDQGKRFVRWSRAIYDEECDYLTPHGNVFDIGISTYRAIKKLSEGLENKGFDARDAGETRELSQGNGSLMRMLPLAYFVNKKSVMKQFSIAGDASSVTHAHPQCKASCGLFIQIAKELLDGKAPEQAYLKAVETTRGHFQKYPSRHSLSEMKRLMGGAVHKLPKREIYSSGFVVHSLEAAIWSLVNTDSYKDAVLTAVNLGYDTDTIGAITGGLAGITYGLDAIPKEWRDTLVKNDMIEDMCKKYGESLKR